MTDKYEFGKFLVDCHIDGIKLELHTCESTGEMSPVLVGLTSDKACVLRVKQKCYAEDWLQSSDDEKLQCLLALREEFAKRMSDYDSGIF